jgi:hypothetical protein
VKISGRNLHQSKDPTLEIGQCRWEDAGGFAVDNEDGAGHEGEESEDRFGGESLTGAVFRGER